MAAHANAQLPVLRTAAAGWQAEGHSLPAPESDAALVAGVLAGDAACKEQLYRRHVRYVAGMSARLLRSIDGAEDVVQDTFAIAFAKIGSLRDPEAFRGWLASIAVSQVHRLLARQRLLRLVGLDRSLDDAPLEALAREDCSIEARSELAALDAVLQQLPSRQRVAWMLRYVEGEPLDVVADACRCSRATVKRWIAAADARIRQRVNLASTEDAS
jgi:RNA polymerase sigma-70 factor (ECF subfamily)